MGLLAKEEVRHGRMALASNNRPPAGLLHHKPLPPLRTEPLRGAADEIIAKI